MSIRRTALYAASAALAVTAGVLAPTSSAAPAPTSTDGCFASVPDAGSTTPVQICYTVHKPATASAKKPVPVLLEGHGWGGSRTREAAAFSRYLDRGYGVLSFDQRGFGESGGKAHVMDPKVEGVDVRG